MGLCSHGPGGHLPAHASCVDEVSLDHSLGSDDGKGYDGLIAVGPDLEAVPVDTPRKAEG